MKKYKSMIILLAVFVVLIALYFVMMQVNKNQAEKDTEETLMVTEISDLASMEYTDGKTTMSFTKVDGAWQSTDNAELRLDSEAVEKIAEKLCNVEAVRVLEGADEPASYGLDEPTYTITLTDEAGIVTTLYIGDEAEGNYYATINDKVVIYTINSSASDALVFDITTLEAEEEVEEETSEETTEETSQDTTE